MHDHRASAQVQELTSVSPPYIPIMSHSPSLFKSAMLKTASGQGSRTISDDTSDVATAASEEAVLQARPVMKKTASTPPFGHQLKKKRRLLFKARMSKFDISNPETSNDTFRGFYTLFWIAMAFYVIQTAIRCYEQEGVIISLGFFRLFSKDSLALLISDMTMVATTVFSVLFSKLFVWGILPYDPVGVILQHMCQTVFLFLNIYWTFWR